MAQPVIRDGRLLLTVDGGCCAARPVAEDHPDYAALRAAAVDLDAVRGSDAGADAAFTARLRASVNGERRTA
ncbi:hypothetical protein [Actinomadura hibisca]|uniref:hypothetical protein n=1 Tax=Actinomadura hibisca TaxID=68565 RepID=UPI00083312F7|nr:hypothetical protein [Actinomadura hibisca]